MKMCNAHLSVSKSPSAPSDEGAVTASAVTGGENKNVLSLSETSKNLLHFLSLRQKSKIFATSLIRGRLLIKR